MSKRPRSLSSVAFYKAEAAARGRRRQRNNAPIIVRAGKVVPNKNYAASSAAWQPTMAEIKAIDIEEQTYIFRDPNTATNIILLNGVQTGSGFFNRVGSRIEMKSLQINGFLGPNTAATSTTPSNLRMLIVYDRQPVGALPTVSDVLQDRNQVGTAITGGLSHINLDNRDRFTILRDMRWIVPTVTAGVVTGISIGVGDPWTVNTFIKLKGLGTHFKSTSNPATIADISTGALYALFVTETNDSDWVVEADFRLRYDDK